MEYTLSAPQTVFCLFYAIAWGMIANAQIKWKAFNWPIALAGFNTPADNECKPAWSRLKTALCILFILPIPVFLLLLWLLDAARPASFTTISAAFQFFLAMLAAHAAFGISRIWTSRLEAHPDRYYLSKGRPELGEPGLNEVHLDPKWSNKNLAVGVGYIVVAIAAAWIAGALGR